MSIQFTETTVTKAGSEVADGFQYDVSARVVNNVLTEVNCNIYKKVKTPYDDGNGGTQNVEENQPIGYVRFQNGRTATEITSDEDMVKHITKFSEILAFVRSDMVTVIKK